MRSNNIDELLAQLLDKLGLNSTSTANINAPNTLSSTHPQPVALHTSGPAQYSPAPLGCYLPPIAQTPVTPPGFSYPAQYNQAHNQPMYHQAMNQPAQQVYSAQQLLPTMGSARIMTTAQPTQPESSRPTGLAMQM
ncbi:hypothetical protein Tco_0888928 [Tanacetum coccineum]